ncbi:hypothetical protein INR49_010492 [Caranx melampygus]|nr:hypothetical protein INR49_010492 [Caranx melampygus]
MSPLGLRITMTTCAWKVMINTGPWSIILPIASYKTRETLALTANTGAESQLKPLPYFFLA